MTTLPTLCASTPAILVSGAVARETIVSILAECNAMLGTPEALDPANAAQVATFRARLAAVESAVAEEVSADWFVMSARNVLCDADSVIGALMGDDGDAAPIVGACKPEVRALPSYRRFTV